MALDFLSISGILVELERLFLNTKLTISDLWSRIRSNTVKALECLRSWLNIKDSDIEALIRIVLQAKDDKDIVEDKGTEMST